MADVVKYGVQISNRVFVGGVAFDTKEAELKDFFSQYGKVKECKIIKDNQSISRGFAFITFESKHDAFQTQQLGTVFFNQKKLNLGPAIRQKGVVFNGATDYENEPVLSTGVYISPNGVWYFDTAEATKEKTPGSPPIYSATLVHKIQQTTQEYQSVCPVNQQTSGLIDSASSAPFSVLQAGDAPVIPHQATQIMQNQNHHPTGYVHHTHPPIGSSNIHVAFQNMTLSSHPAPSLPGHHVHLATNPSAQSSVYPAHSTIQTINNTHSPLVHMQYGRVGEMLVPCYSQNVRHTMEGSASLEARNTHLNSNCHYQLPLQMQEYYSMMPPNGIRPGIREPHVYPVYDFYHPTVVYPPPAYTNSPVCEKTQPGPSGGKRGMKRREKFAGQCEKDSELKVDTK